MHIEARAGASQIINDLKLSQPVKVLDLGGRNLNGTIHDFFAPGSSITVVDYNPHHSVDIVADVRTWRAPEKYDVVISTELFEHCDGWEKALDCAHAALNENGYFILTTAGPGRPPHTDDGRGIEEDPDQYYGNVDPGYLLDELAKRFESFEVRRNYESCDVYAWARSPRKEYSG